MAAKRQMIVPSKAEMWEVFENLEASLGSVMRRWDDGVSPEIRAEIMTVAYEPVLRMLIRGRRRRAGGPPR